MSKLTPPAPQNAKARTRFMLNNPKHPKAKAWLAYMSNKLAGQALREYSTSGDKRSLKDFISDFITNYAKKGKPNGKVTFRSVSL